MSELTLKRSRRKAYTSFYASEFTETLKAGKTWGLNKPKKKPEAVTDKAMATRISHIVQSGGGISPIDFERILGNNDMLPVNYFERGLLAAKAVCRVFVPDDEETFEMDAAWGTGFLIGPNLLITNHHVLRSAEIANNSFAEFDYELDVAGRPKQSKRFALRPDIAFITNPHEVLGSDSPGLDYTIVAVDEIADDNSTRLSNYGFVRLSSLTGKVQENEFVSIIQHPSGDQKQLAIRENEVLKIGDKTNKYRNNFLWYASDTAPGSSGSPVFNDNWQVVALHHSSVPETKVESGVVFVKLTNGKWMPKEDAEYTQGAEYTYIANEGVRISCILEDVKKQCNSGEVPGCEDVLRRLVEDAGGIRPFAGMPSGISIVNPRETARVTASPELEKKPSANKHSAAHFENCEGFDRDFLGVTVDLPALNNASRFGRVARIIGSNDTELKYTHFSLEFNAERKLAFYTACNIDGKRWTNLSRGTDKWFYDERIERSIQAGDELYGNEPGGNYFDRGHLVRRLDPVWGPLDVAGRANDDTFHWTNCSPQYKGFNQGQELWQGLENHILYNTDKENVRACVYTGPIFHDKDEIHRDIPIPQYFWKVVVVADSAGKLHSAAFVVSQKKWATNIPFEILPTADFNNFQTTIDEIQKRTGLLFSDAIRACDVRRTAKTPNKPLRGYGDIEMDRRV